MKKKAIISVLSSQPGIDENIEVVTPGSYYKKENDYYAVYDETEISGMEGTTTTLRINSDKLSLIRIGSTSTKMEFDKNKESLALYNTPYGTLELRIQTKSLDIDVNDTGADVYIKYNMSVSGQAPLSTDLKINIKTRELD